MTDRDDRIAHLPREDKDEAFCGKRLEEGTLLSSTLEAASCDACIRAALAENASIVDRRGKAESLGQILQRLLGAPVIELRRAMDPPDSSVYDRFPPELAELSGVPAALCGEMFLDLPAYVLSCTGHFPTPATLVISMLSFYLDVLKQSVAAGEIDEPQGKERADQVIALIDFCRSQRTDKSPKLEYPLTIDQWPEELRK